MNPLVIIAAHAGTEATIQRHLPFWRQQSTDLVMFAPAESVPQIFDLPIWAYGRKCHHCPEASERFKMMLKLCVESRSDTFLFFEYDSIALGPMKVKPGEIGANVFFDNRPERGFVGTMFTHPPMSFDREMAQQLLAGYQWNDEVGNFWDRDVGRIVEKRTLKFDNFLVDGRGYSQNTIEPRHYLDLVKAVENGAQFIHGIKSAEALHQILFAMEPSYEEKKASLYGR